MEPHRGGDADHEEEAASAEHDPSRGAVDEVPGRSQVGRDAMEHDEPRERAREQRAERRSEHPPAEPRAQHGASHSDSELHAHADRPRDPDEVHPLQPLRQTLSDRQRDEQRSRDDQDHEAGCELGPRDRVRRAHHRAEVDDAHHDRQRGSERDPDAEQQKRGGRDVPVDVPATLVAARGLGCHDRHEPVGEPEVEEPDQRGDGAQEQPGAELGAGKGVSGEGHHHEAHGEEEPAVQAECEPALQRGAGTRGAGRRRFGCCRGQRLGGG